MKAGTVLRYFLKSLIATNHHVVGLDRLRSGGRGRGFCFTGCTAANDDGSSPAVPIGSPINFFGVTHTELFVNNNGNVTFGAPLSTFTPFGLVGTRQPIIAPLFADVDTNAPGSGVVRFGTTAGRPDLFVIDWVSIGYFNQHDDKLNSFQLILQDLSAVPDFVAGDFRIIFNYDRIQWEQAANRSPGCEGEHRCLRGPGLGTA